MCEQFELAILGCQNYFVVKSIVEFPGYVMPYTKKMWSLPHGNKTLIFYSLISTVDSHLIALYLHEVALEEHLEASAGTECGGMGT